MNTEFINEKKDYNNYRKIIESNYKEMMDGLVTEEETADYITKAISAAEPCKNDPSAWFWMFEEPSNMPSDCRVDLVYETTYMNTAIIMYSLVRYDSIRNIPGLMDILSKVLVGCMGRGFMGHGFENIAGFVNAMRIFARAGIKAFLREYSEQFGEFAEFFEEKRDLLSRLAEDKVRYDWGYSYKQPASAILELLSHDRCPIRLFVYGTLMQGQRAHHYLEDAKYLGEFILGGYSIYDLGSFPGIIPDRSDRRTIGEVYEVSSEMIPFMDNYEGEGSLYIRREECVHNENKCLYANVYVYNSDPNGKRFEGKWGN